MAKKTLYAALFHFKRQKGFVAPIVFVTVGNVSKWLFEWQRLPTPALVRKKSECW